MIGIDIDDVLLELSYRTTTGIVDLTDPKQIAELGKILRENGVRNAYDIATMAGFNYSLLKEANEEEDEEEEEEEGLGFKKDDIVYRDKDKKKTEYKIIKVNKKNREVTIQQDVKGAKPETMTFDEFSEDVWLLKIKIEKGNFEGPPNPLNVGKMKATTFEPYIAYLLSIAAENKGKSMTQDNKDTKVSGVFIGDGEPLYNNIRTKYKEILVGNYAKLGSNQPCTKEKGEKGYNWAKWSGKATDTPKTDIIGGQMKLSIKKGRAQLMSPAPGKVSELTATFMAAANHVQLYSKSALKQEVIDSLDKIKKMAFKLKTGIRTVGGVRMRELKFLHKYYTTKDPKEKAELKEKYEEIKKRLGQTDRQMRSYYDNTNAGLMELIQEGESESKKILNILKKASESPIMKQALVWEAASGAGKFGLKSSGFSPKVLSVSKDGQSVGLQDISRMDSPGVKYFMQKSDYQITFKTGGYGSVGELHLGYYCYQSFRLKCMDINDKVKGLKGKLNEEFTRFNDALLLNESFFDDVITGTTKVISAVGKGIDKGIDAAEDWLSKKWKAFLDGVSKALDWLMEIIDDFVNWVTDTFDAAIKLLDKGLEGVFDVLGATPVVSLSVTIDPDKAAMAG